jgi:hypothetical protein
MTDASKAWATEQIRLGKSVFGQASGARPADIERAITALNNARSVFTYEHSPAQWAEIAMDLGRIYSRRKNEGRTENKKTAITYYSEALTVYEWKSHPIDCAVCHSEIGNLSLDLADGIDRHEKKLALLHYEIVLVLISRESWPELWHKTHLELSLLYRKYAMFSESADLSLSEEHSRMAFDPDENVELAFYDLMRTTYDLCIRLFELQLELRHAKGHS